MIRVIALLFITLICSFCYVTNGMQRQKRNNKPATYIIVIYTSGLDTGRLLLRGEFIEYIHRPTKKRYIAKVDVTIVNSIFKVIKKTEPLWKNPPYISEEEQLKLIPKLYPPYPTDGGITLIIKQDQKILGGLDDFELRLIKFRRYEGYRDLEWCIDTLFDIIDQHGKEVGILSKSEIQQYERQRDKDYATLLYIRKKKFKKNR